jgi:hypothetical protein
MARLKQLVVDCHHPASLARFWAAALDEFEIRHYDDAETARLATLGFTPETDPGVILDGPMLELCFQKVDVPSITKNPLHPDIETADRRAETERLVTLGASVREEFEHHTWMEDPEGNDFCLSEA